MTEFPRLAEPLMRWRDNPFLWAESRRRLRRKEAVPTLFIALTLGCVGTLLGALASPAGGGAWPVVSGLLLAVMLGALYFRATGILAATVLDARTTGLLDFYRATPTTPWTQALGYLLGCPAREWAVTGTLAPFWLAANVRAGSSLPASLAVLGVVALGAVLFHLVALWTGLVGSNRRRVGGSAGAVLVVLGLAALGLQESGLVTPAHLTPLPSLLWLIPWAQPAGFLAKPVAFFGLALPPPVFTVLVQGTAGAFLLLAVTRKLERDGAPSFSRVGALGFFAVLSVLMLGGSWPTLTAAAPADGASGLAWVGGAYLVGSTLTIALLLYGLAPSALDATRALRQAQARNHPEVPWSWDGASTAFLLLPFLALVVAGWLLVVLAGHDQSSTAALLGVDLAVALLALVGFNAFLAGAGEYARLVSRKAYRSTLLLIGFTVLVVPVLLAAVVAALPEGLPWAVYVGAVSPLFSLTALARPLPIPALNSDGTSSPQLALSLLVTLGGAAWCWLQVFQLRRALRDAPGPKPPATAG